MLPNQTPRWQRLENLFRDLTRRYGYEELRTPLFEDTDLFRRTAGETSDIVTKEMYDFLDKGGRSITLRPEGTAPVMRSVIEHSLCPPGNVLRLNYIVSFFRYGRPGRGRMRQAHQLGCELIGASGAAADAEAIEIASTIATQAGLANHEVVLNSIGRGECRARYREAVLTHVASWLADQTIETQEKTRKNALGLLDSKDPKAQEALQGVPPITDYLEDESAARFARVQQILTDAKISFRVDPMVVRGLDYYTETVFEGLTSHLPGLSIFGGGRYDNLIKDLGGPPTPSVGFGMGIERMLIALEDAGFEEAFPKPDAFVVQATPEAADAVLALARELRTAGLSAITDPDGRSLKSQLRQADKSGARFALVLGQDELTKGTVQAKALAASEQFDVPREEIVEWVRGRS